MKAVVYVRNVPPEDALQVRETSKPVPKENEVRIRVYAAAVNATDVGMPGKSIPGDTLAGEIEAVGAAVTRFKPGDPVYGATGLSLGAQAEFKCMPEDAALAIKPANMSYAEAAAIVDGSLTALPFLRDNGNIQRGQNVLINGASGSVGTAAVQLAKHFGACVTGVCSAANLDLVRSLGADAVVDYTREDFTRTGESYDIIFDAVAKSSFSRCKSALRPTGIYLTTFPAPSALARSLWSSIAGGKRAGFAATGLRRPSKRAQDLAFIRQLVEAGAYRAIIDRRYPLDQVAEAYRYVATGHKKGNVVLVLEAIAQARAFGVLPSI